LHDPSLANVVPTLGDAVVSGLAPVHDRSRLPQEFHGAPNSWCRCRTHHRRRPGGQARDQAHCVAVVWPSAVCLALLSIKVENTVLLNALVFVTGVFVFSSQVLVYDWVSQLFPGPPVPGSASAFSFNAMAAYAPARTNAPDNCRLREPASYECLLPDVNLWFCTQTLASRRHRVRGGRIRK
jgi:hypothetical protein